MALILSIETSASICSTALHSDGQLIDTIEASEPQTHAAKLAVSIEELLKRNSLPINKVEAVAVSSGPGSYTGLRIGTSVAKGICMGLNIPLIDIPTLFFLADHVSHTYNSGAFFCPMIDARRMEVYAQVFDSKLNEVTKTEALVIDENSFRELLDRQPVLFFGDGAEKCKDVIRHKHALFVDGIFPKAAWMGSVAEQKFKNRQFADLTEFTPFYLKEFVAKKAQPIF
jgi:tRNA threonylcarbamoyladenosine biosynthesis protein TsaB